MTDSSADLLVERDVPVTGRPRSVRALAIAGVLLAVVAAAVFVPLTLVGCGGDGVAVLPASAVP